MGIDVGDAGSDQLRRCHEQLIALLRRSLAKRPFQIQSIAFAVSAGHLPVDVARDAELHGARPDRIAGDERIDCRFDEGGLVSVLKNW